MLQYEDYQQQQQQQQQYKLLEQSIIDRVNLQQQQQYPNRVVATHDFAGAGYSGSTGADDQHLCRLNVSTSLEAIHILQKGDYCDDGEGDSDYDDISLIEDCYTTRV